MIKKWYFLQLTKTSRCRSPSTNVMWVTSDVEMWWGGLWWHLGILARYGLSITLDMTPLGDPHLCAYIALLQAYPPGKTTQPQIWQVNNINLFSYQSEFYVCRWKLFLLTFQDAIFHLCDSYMHCFLNFSFTSFLSFKECSE